MVVILRISLMEALPKCVVYMCVGRFPESLGLEYGTVSAA